MIYTYILFHVTTVNSLWFSWLLYKLPLNGILSFSFSTCSMHIVGPNPSEQRAVLLVYTLLHSAFDRKKRRKIKERERGQINKEKYNRETWFALSRMRMPGVPFSLTSPIYFGSFFCFYFPTSTIALSSNFRWFQWTLHFQMF